MHFDEMTLMFNDAPAVQIRLGKGNADVFAKENVWNEGAQRGEFKYECGGIEPLNNRSFSMPRPLA